MDIAAENYGHAVMLKPRGDLTEDTLSVFQQAVEHQLENEDIVDVVLDMENVPFVDSMALEYFLDLQDRLGKKFGQVHLARCDPHVHKILEINRLEGQFEMFDDVYEALKVMRS